MARVSDLYQQKSQRPKTTYNAFEQWGKLGMYIRCSDLIQVDMFTKSDPLCVVFIKNMGQWCELGRTEAILNDLNPRFCQSIELEIGSADNLPMKFTVYDLANFSNNDLRNHDVIGSVELELRTLLEDTRPHVGELRSPGDLKTRGTIYVYTRTIKDTSSTLRLQIKGSKLSRRSVFTKCNAYLEVCSMITRKREEFHPVYRTPIIKRSQQPRWQSMVIPLHKLENEDTNSDILFQCWNFIQDNADELIGEVQCSLNELLKQENKVLQLYPKQQQSKSKKIKSSGCLKFLQCHIERQYSVMDFIRGGCKMKFVCAIDFTLSNGDSCDEYSLHTTRSEHNEYLEVLRSLGPVLTHYSFDQQYPVYGFGARVNGITSHCFPLNGNDESPYIDDLQGIIEKYLHRIQSLQFSGPTFLAPVLRRILRDHVPQSCQSSQCYVTVLILLDGIVNDLDEVLIEIEKTQNLPLTIVLAEVGPNHFNSLFDICRKKRNLPRHNVHFVAVRSNNNKQMSQRKVRELSAEICQDMITFMKLNAIHPNPAKIMAIKPLYESLEFESTAERKSLARSLPHLHSMTSHCPSCGSKVYPAI